MWLDFLQVCPELDSVLYLAWCQKSSRIWLCFMHRQIFTCCRCLMYDIQIDAWFLIHVLYHVGSFLGFQFRFNHDRNTEHLSRRSTNWRSTRIHNCKMSMWLQPLRWSDALKMASSELPTRFTSSLTQNLTFQIWNGKKEVVTTWTTYRVRESSRVFVSTVKLQEEPVRAVRKHAGYNIWGWGSTNFSDEKTRTWRLAKTQGYHWTLKHDIRQKGWDWRDGTCRCCALG